MEKKDGRMPIPMPEADSHLLRMLDRGIDDMQAGRTLSHEEAIQEIRRIRERRKEERPVAI